MLNFNDQGEIEIYCSNEISDHGFSDDYEFSQIQESMSEQFISKDKNEIGYSHLISPSTSKTSSCNILWQELKLSHFVIRVYYNTFPFFIKSVCQNLQVLSAQMSKKVDKYQNEIDNV